jgi:hypothetical protein
MQEFTYIGHRRCFRSEAGAGNLVGAGCINRMIFLVAAWEIYNKQKAKLSWDLTVLNPPWVRPLPSFRETIVHLVHRYSV